MNSSFDDLVKYPFEQFNRNFNWTFINGFGMFKNIGRDTTPSPDHLSEKLREEPCFNILYLLVINMIFPDAVFLGGNMLVYEERINGWTNEIQTHVERNLYPFVNEGGEPLLFIPFILSSENLQDNEKHQILLFVNNQKRKIYIIDPNPRSVLNDENAFINFLHSQAVGIPDGYDIVTIYSKVNSSEGLCMAASYFVMLVLLLNISEIFNPHNEPEEIISELLKKIEGRRDEFQKIKFNNMLAPIDNFVKDEEESYNDLCETFEDEQVFTNEISEFIRNNEKLTDVVERIQKKVINYLSEEFEMARENYFTFKNKNKINNK